MPWRTKGNRFSSRSCSMSFLNLSQRFALPSSHYGHSSYNRTERSVRTHGKISEILFAVFMFPRFHDDPSEIPCLLQLFTWRMFIQIPHTPIFIRSILLVFLPRLNTETILNCWCASSYQHRDSMKPKPRMKTLTTCIRLSLNVEMFVFARSTSPEVSFWKVFFLPIRDRLREPKVAD